MMKILKKLFNRISFMVLVVVLELFLLIKIIDWFNSFGASVIETVLRLLSLIVILWLVNNSKHLSSDMIWILLIVASPIFGTALYLALGANLFTSRTFYSIVRSTADAQKYYEQDRFVMAELGRQAPDLAGQFKYISASAGFPFYRNREFDYYPSGEEGFPFMLEALRSAKRFIFMEYFIIEEGKMWDSIHEILKEKAAEGLDVRVMYDDLGSFRTLSMGYAKKLEDEGIKCIPFNRINPMLGIIMNHRDHRKILVVDGETAFSGGVNLADEYINERKRFGYWKDNIIRIRGEAVWSYTVMFLTMWNALRNTDADYEAFRACAGSEGDAESAATSESAPAYSAVPGGSTAGDYDGYIAPYGETPLDNEIVSQDIYMNIINQARNYVYIVTPYLIIDTEFINALILAAKRGVDVRILTPGIPDKKLVWRVTRSYYRLLIEGGVNITEYTPGFVHSKVFVSDDRVATVGTINLDYRSLYLHFENGTYLYGSSKVQDIKHNLMKAMAAGRVVQKGETGAGLLDTLTVSVVRLFAPLL